MIIKSVKLNNFRNHETFLLSCWKMTTMITGENGGGKTSILEAIYEATQGKSFRAVDREILKRGEEFYRVELDYTEKPDRGQAGARREGRGGVSGGRIEEGWKKNVFVWG